MIHQSLRPGVEHRDKADSARKTPLPILGKGGEDLIDRFEQKTQQDLFVAENQGVEEMRNCEDQVEVSDGQQLGAAVVEPFFLCQALTLRTVAVAAGIVGRPLKAAMVAFFKVAAKDRGPADLNQVKDGELFGGQAIFLAIGLAVLPEHISCFI